MYPSLSKEKRILIKQNLLIPSNKEDNVNNFILIIHDTEKIKKNA